MMVGEKVLKKFELMEDDLIDQMVLWMVERRIVQKEN